MRNLAQPDLFAGGARMVSEEAVDLTVASKRCCRCASSKPVVEFGKSSREPDGLRPECKACRRASYVKAAPRLRAKQTAYYRANTEERRAAQRTYNQANATEIAERGRRRYAKAPADVRARGAAARKAWAIENRDKVRSDNKAWRVANRDRLREKERAYNLANADRRREREAIRRREKPEWDKAKKNARRARQLATVGSFTPDQWTALCALLGPTCLCCGRIRKMTADHVVPLSANGMGDIGNIQPLCQPCNSRKGTRTIDYRPTRIESLVAAGTWPNGWDGDEPTADAWLDAIFPDGSVQPLLFGGAP